MPPKIRAIRKRKYDKKEEEEERRKLVVPWDVLVVPPLLVHGACSTQTPSVSTVVATISRTMMKVRKWRRRRRRSPLSHSPPMIIT